MTSRNKQYYSSYRGWQGTQLGVMKIMSNENNTIIAENGELYDGTRVVCSIGNTRPDIVWVLPSPNISNPLF